MEDESEKQTTEKVEEKKETKVDIENSFIADLPNVDDAGPSRLHLPGAVVTPKVHRTGLSKSEHNINHIITKQDLTNALKLTSLSFATNNPPTINFNFKDLKIPIFKKSHDAAKVETIDMKKLMASCFKFNRDTPVVSNLPEVPVAALQTSTIRNEVQEIPDCSITAVTTNAQTDDTFLVKKPNEVIVTRPCPIEAKQSKEKKKPPGNLSERSDLGLATRDSLSSIGSNVCRICMTRGRERLISPCNCKGSLANVHLSCLERWLNQVGRNHCELCGYSYPAIRTPRYTVLQALRLWFGNPRNRSHLQSDCLIFWLLSTVTAGLLAVCIVGTQYFVIEGNKFGISHRITETAMDFFMAIVLMGYSVTVYLLWKDHYVMWNRWRRANVNVRLLLSPDANPVPFVPRSERPRYSVV